MADITVAGDAYMRTRRVFLHISPFKNPFIFEIVLILQSTLREELDTALQEALDLYCSKN